jgi:hypothetical protein
MDFHGAGLFKVAHFGENSMTIERCRGSRRCTVRCGRDDPLRVGRGAASLGALIRHATADRRRDRASEAVQ